MITKKENKLFSSIAFLINPFFLTMINLRSLLFNGKNTIYIMIFTFCIGYTFIPQYKWDAVRYIKDFEDICQINNFSEFLNSLKYYKLYKADTGIMYIFFILSRITSNFQVVFGISSTVYFCLIIKIYLFIKKSNKNYNKNYLILLILTYFMIFSFYDFNGIRFHNSKLLFLLGILYIYILKKINGIFILLLSGFLHSSMIPLILLSLIFYILRKFDKLYFFIGFGLSFIGIFIKNIMTFLIPLFPSAIIGKINAYILEKSSPPHYYAYFISTGYFLLSSFCLFLIFFNRKKIKSKYKLEFFKYSFIIWGFSNFFIKSTSYSLVARYRNIFIYTIIIQLFFNYKMLKSKYQYKILLICFVLVGVLNQVYVLYTGGKSFNIKLLLSLFNILLVRISKNEFWQGVLF